MEVSSPTENMSFCCGVLFFSIIFVLYVGDKLPRMAPKHSADMLSTVPKTKKVVMCCMEIMGVPGKHRLGRSYSAVCWL